MHLPTQIELRSVGALLPHARNSRTHSDEQVAQVAASIREFGWTNPILVDGDGVVIAGHARLLAARKLGMEEVPVIVLAHLAPAQKRALVIADNKLALNAGWDEEMLRSEVAALQEDGFDLDLVGFSDEELRILLADHALAGEGDAAGANEIPDPPVKPVSRAGDLWVIGRHRLICGDCQDAATVARLLDGARVNVAITSPPYASQRTYDPSSGFHPIPPDDYTAWFGEVARNIESVLAPEGSYFLNIKEHSEDGERSLYVKDLVLAHKREWGWRFVDEFCWRNTANGVPGKWPNRLKNAWEPVFHFCRSKEIKFRPKGAGHESEDVVVYAPGNPSAPSGSGLLGCGAEKTTGIAWPSNVIEAKAEGSQGSHSAPFPRALVEFFLKAFSDEGDCVFDGFMGSGTTMAAAHVLGRIGYRDHSLTAEYRIFGPPGTGKTTNLTRQIRRAVNRFGKDSVLVTSFSRAAAAELAGQELPVSADRVGTLHSHCWHALGRPEIAEVRVEEWNRENPHLRISAVKKERKLNGEESEEESVDDVRSGDYWLSELNRSRGMLRPAEDWPAALRDFALRWNRYKVSRRVMDFCDLIETAARDIRIAPKRPDVIFADEAQDLNPMQLALVRRWGENAEYFIIAADDDQTIYSWCGATPDAVLDPEIPEDHKIFLKQSHRVPRAVHARATRLIHQVTRRQEKVYEPRSEDGRCMQISTGGYKSPEYWILKTIMQHLENGQTVMLLASCSYMLHPLITVLRQRGIPFHNPYRKSAGFWNPLRHGRTGSSTNRVLSLLGPKRWTRADIKLWAEWLTPRGTLRAGAKALIDGADDSIPLTAEWLTELFEPDALDGLLGARGDSRQLAQWLSRRIAPEFHGRVQFPLAVALAGGSQALEDSPRVIVGTIHSVKGGQADAVFLFPDLSAAGDAAYQRHGAQRDSVIRLFYVGMTRARHTLYICQRESSMAVVI